MFHICRFFAYSVDRICDMHYLHKHLRITWIVCLMRFTSYNFVDDKQWTWFTHTAKTKRSKKSATFPRSTAIVFLALFLDISLALYVAHFTTTQICDAPSSSRVCFIIYVAFCHFGPLSSALFSRFLTLLFVEIVIKQSEKQGQTTRINQLRYGWDCATLHCTNYAKRAHT